MNSTAPSTAPEPADPWAAITLGSTVLATVGLEDGWWEAAVLAVDPATDMLTLSWRGWPHLPSFKTRRSSVAVLAPAPR